MAGPPRSTGKKGSATSRSWPRPPRRIEIDAGLNVALADAMSILTKGLALVPALLVLACGGTSPPPDTAGDTKTDVPAEPKVGDSNRSHQADQGDDSLG